MAGNSSAWALALRSGSWALEPESAALRRWAGGQCRVVLHVVPASCLPAQGQAENPVLEVSSHFCCSLLGHVWRGGTGTGTGGGLRPRGLWSKKRCLRGRVSDDTGCQAGPA